MKNSILSPIIICILANYACGSAGASGTNDTAAANAGKASDGQAIFRQYCVTCHGADGKLGLNGAKDLSQSTLPLDERILVVAKGRKVMTPFEDILSAEEIKAVAQYTLTLHQ